MRVLLVANETEFTTAVAHALRSRGHDVSQVGAEVEQLAAAPCDLMLVELEREDGVRLCRELRTRTDVALIGVTSRGREALGVAALREGADDYVARPVNRAELLARIDAVLRRTRPRPSGQLAVGRLRVELDQQRACLDGEPVPLTRKEFQLLVALARTQGTVVTKEQLLSEIWNSTDPPKSRTLESHVNTLRRKLRPAARIENVRGVGYRVLAGPVRSRAPLRSPEAGQGRPPGNQGV